MTDNRLREELEKRGELRHERCRWGTLTETFTASVMDLDAAAATDTDPWVPGVGPLCTWQPQGPTPPALKRRWGGDIEFHRDCAVCDCYAEIVVPPEAKEE